MTRLFVTALLALACGSPPPPAAISVDPDLPDGVHVAAARAVDAWCAVSERTGWCPELVDAGGEAAVVAGHWGREIDVTSGKPGAAARNNGGVSVELSANLLAAGYADPEYWTGPLVHEFGHFGIEDHEERSALMRAKHEGPEAVPHSVDGAAVDAWCSQQGC